VFRLAVDGVPLVAMHRNLSWATDAGLQLDSGAFVLGIERAAGVSAVTIGKPSRACFDAGLEMLGTPAAETLMVGDDLDADVLGAQAVGIRGVLVRTGKYRPGAERGTPRPDAVVDSIVDVPVLFGA
jgi:ribonucleotide monophosphatase NagD (HAD superfamily)